MKPTFVVQSCDLPHSPMGLILLLRCCLAGIFLLTRKKRHMEICHRCRGVVFHR